MKTSYELWTMRKQFALQLASMTFMTYIMCLTSRLPSRFHISRSTGQIYMSELMPGMVPFIVCIQPLIKSQHLTQLRQGCIGTNLLRLDSLLICNIF